MKNLITTAIVLWSVFSTLPVSAQPIGLVNDIPVIANGDTLLSAWAGGINNGQVSPIDLNGDGKKDLFVFDRTDNRYITLINEGSSGQVRYVYDPEYMFTFPSRMDYWSLLNDYDNDGDADIFTGNKTNGVKIYRNDRATPGANKFTMMVDSLSTWYGFSYLYMHVARTDVPAIYDVDGDGDLDILSWDVPGSEMEYHQNMSIDSGFTHDKLLFIRKSGCFGHFEESPITCSAILGLPPCGTGMLNGKDYPDSPKPKAHTGSTTLALDLNGSGLTDVIVGDIGCDRFYALYNDGTTDIANFGTEEDYYPVNDTAVDIPTFPAAFYLDVDNDGVKDLIAAPNGSSGIENAEGVWLYHNAGANDNPDFKFQKRGFLQDEMLEKGSGAAAAVFDYDGNGLNDLLVGNRSSYNGPVGNLTTFSLYLNTGTASSPVFSLYEDDFLDISTHPTFSGLDNFTPTLADIDADGDDDLFFGEAQGTVYFFENTATGDTADFVFVTDTFAGIDVTNLSAPDFFDLDSDGDQDLIVGNGKGYIGYYENTGDSANASFQLVTDKFGKIKMNDQSGEDFTNGFSHPHIVDYDQDGTVELLVGSILGRVNIYESISLTPGDSFLTNTDLMNYTFGSYTKPASGMIDDSGKPYFFIGIMRGGLLLAKAGGATEREESIAAIPNPEITIYPNPTSGMVTIRTDGIPIREEKKIRLTDMQGALLLEKTFRDTTYSLNPGNLTPGVYFVHVEWKTGSSIRKLVVIK